MTIDTCCKRERPLSSLRGCALGRCPSMLWYECSDDLLLKLRAMRAARAVRGRMPSSGISSIDCVDGVRTGVVAVPRLRCVVARLRN